MSVLRRYVATPFDAENDLLPALLATAGKRARRSMRHVPPPVTYDDVLSSLHDRIILIMRRIDPTKTAE